jgi:hypothetical protein
MTGTLRADTLSTVRDIETKGWELRALAERGHEAIEQAITWHKRILDIGEQHVGHRPAGLHRNEGTVSYGYGDCEIIHPKRRGRPRKSPTSVRLLTQRTWDRGRCDEALALLEWPVDEHGMPVVELEMMIGSKGSTSVRYVDEDARDQALREVVEVAHELRNSLAREAEGCFLALDASPLRAVSRYAAHQEGRDFVSLVQIYELGEDMPSNLAVVEGLSELLTRLENEAIDEAGIIAEALRPAFVSQREVSATGRYGQKHLYRVEASTRKHALAQAEVRRVEVLCRNGSRGLAPVESPDPTLGEQVRPDDAADFLHEANSILDNLSADQSLQARTRMRQIAQGRVMGVL